MAFWKRLFGRSTKITYCGRAGLIYENASHKYFVDSEMLTGKPDIVVYWDRILYEDKSETSLTQDEKTTIARAIGKELEYEGLSVEFHPPLI